MSELDQQRILALNVHPRSFGFVVFEGPAMPLHWGAKRNHGQKVAARMPLGPKVAELMAEYAPQVIVVRQPSTKQSMESLNDIINHLVIHKVRIKILSQEAVKQAFPGHNNNKDQIASAVAEQVPELLSILPPRRRIWQSEEYRMTIFDAAAAGIAYFGSKPAKIPVPP
jgi:hypothetical protein